MLVDDVKRNLETPKLAFPTVSEPIMLVCLLDDVCSQLER